MSLEEARNEFIGKWFLEHGGIRCQITNVVIMHGEVSVISEHLKVEYGELKKEGRVNHFDKLEDIEYCLGFIEVIDPYAFMRTCRESHIDEDLSYSLMRIVNALGIPRSSHGVIDATTKEIIEEIEYYTKFAKELWG